MISNNQIGNSKSLFLAACRRERTPRAPVWIMRQAGRYLPEYRALRKKHSFLEVAKSPDLAAEVSLQPFRLLGVDAVIMFSDILIPAEAMGAPIELGDAGPIVKTPIRTAGQVDALSTFDPEQETPFISETIRRLCRGLGDGVPVLGFAAAPWTLACYLVQGHSREGFPAAKTLQMTEPRLFRLLLEKIARATAVYLKAQIAAGAAAVQLFDTWAGELSAASYREFELPATQLLLQELAPGNTPVILYSKASNHLLDGLTQTGANVLSVDWRCDLSDFQRRFGSRLAVQGNVDPCVLLGPVEAVTQSVRSTLELAGGTGHILNLGHGILPETPVENAIAFVREAQSFSSSKPASVAASLSVQPA